MSLDIPSQAKELIGKETTREYVITRKDIARFAHAIDDQNKLYVDDEYAKKTRFGSIIAPPLFCQTLMFDHAPYSELREDGLPKDLEVPLPTEKTFGGSSFFEVGDSVAPGDVIRVRKKITDIYKKAGKTGELYFVVVDCFCTNQKNRMVAHEKATYIHR